MDFIISFLLFLIILFILLILSKTPELFIGNFDQQECLEVVDVHNNSLAQTFPLTRTSSQNFYIKTYSTDGNQLYLKGIATDGTRSLSLVSDQGDASIWRIQGVEHEYGNGNGYGYGPDMPIIQFIITTNDISITKYFDASDRDHQGCDYTNIVNTSGSEECQQHDCAVMIESVRLPSAEAVTTQRDLFTILIDTYSHVNTLAEPNTDYIMSTGLHLLSSDDIEVKLRDVMCIFDLCQSTNQPPASHRIDAKHTPIDTVWEFEPVDEQPCSQRTTEDDCNSQNCEWDTNTCYSKCSSIEDNNTCNSDDRCQWNQATARCNNKEVNGPEPVVSSEVEEGTSSCNRERCLTKICELCMGADETALSRCNDIASDAMNDQLNRGDDTYTFYNNLSHKIYNDLDGRRQDEMFYRTLGASGRPGCLNDGGDGSNLAVDVDNICEQMLTP